MAHGQVGGCGRSTCADVQGREAGSVALGSLPPHHTELGRSHVCPTGEGPDLQVLWRCVMISRAFMAQMPQGTKANMLHAHLACLTRMEQVGNNWLFRSATFHFNQKAHPRRVVITPGFTNLSHSEIGKWVVGEIEVDV